MPDKTVDELLAEMRAVKKFEEPAKPKPSPRALHEDEKKFNELFGGTENEC